MRCLFLPAIFAILAACGSSPPNPGPLDRVSALERVATGFSFTEGPAFDRFRHLLLFSDIPGDAIHGVAKDGSVSVMRSPSGNSNGLVVDDEGRVYCAEHGGRRISRVELDGTVTTIVDRHESRRLNSPNDLALGHEGSIYFTDPPYGLGREPSEQTGSHVYRLSPHGDLTIIWEGTPSSRPNGITMSASRRTLYVAFSDENLVRKAGVGDYGVPATFEPFVTTSRGPDGMTTDIRGNLYVATIDGVEVFDRLGTLIGVIRVPERPTNVTFGGEEMNWLYITAGKSLYRIRTSVRGVR